LGVGINLDFIKLFFVGEPYWVGLGVVPVLLLAYLFLGVYYNFSVWFKLTNQTYYGTLITLLGAGVTIGGNFLLIPVAGYMGSSIAALLCYFTMAVSLLSAWATVTIPFLIPLRKMPVILSLRMCLPWLVATH
jgi:O-antigen/teichoic acid export membrane protein